MFSNEITFGGQEEKILLLTEEMRVKEYPKPVELHTASVKQLKTGAGLRFKLNMLFVDQCTADEIKENEHYNNVITVELIAIGFLILVGLLIT